MKVLSKFKFAVVACLIFTGSICFGNQCGQCDIAGGSGGENEAMDGRIDLNDLAALAGGWIMRSDCTEENNWCQYTDLNKDSLVNFDDLLLLANCWLNEDNTPPEPSPAQWASGGQPNNYSSDINRIIMTAETAYDSWSGSEVEYNFECTKYITVGGEVFTAGADAYSSGWQKNPTYITSALTTGYEYYFRVYYRDAVGNASQSSTQYSAIAGLDVNCPIPAAAQWAVRPYSTDNSATISMQAQTATDPEGSTVYYKFRCISHVGLDSNWMTSNTCNLPADASSSSANIAIGELYTFVVMVMDAADNYCDLSDPASVIAGSSVTDYTCPTPNPAQWAEDGQPNFVYEAGSTQVTLTMTAQTATDDISGSNVSYYFECVSIDDSDLELSDYSSSWQSNPTYEIPMDPTLAVFNFRVYARDHYHNTTQPSETASAFIGDDMQSPEPAQTQWLYLPVSVSSSDYPLGITMTAQEAIDPQGNAVEYYFACTSHYSFDSGWISEPVYNVPQDTPVWNNTQPLVEGQEYTFTVIARDRSANNNSCTVSDPASAILEFIESDVNPPSPSPTEWLSAPAMINSSDPGYGVTMSAVEATDAEGSGVEYYFACTSHEGLDSGWITSNSYSIYSSDTTLPDLIAEDTYIFTVQARDTSRNQNTCASSVAKSVNLKDNTVIDDTPPEPNPLTWVTAPYIYRGYDDDNNLITLHIMTCEEATADSGEVQYYFQATNDSNAKDSGWIDTATYSYHYTGFGPTNALYRVKAREVVRDKTTNEILEELCNETSWSSWAGF